MTFGKFTSSSVLVALVAFLLVLTAGCNGGGNYGLGMGGGNVPPVTPPPPPPNPNATQWTWVSGSDTVGSFGSGPMAVYGTQGQPDAANTPSGRFGAATWKDKDGNIWIFGGTGIGSAGNTLPLNDFWEYSPATKQWTWIGGSQNGGQPGVYGTEDVAAATNIPGARFASVAWTDPAGNLWLFGGAGFDSNDHAGYLNDLWEFNTSTKQWTWVSGSNTVTSPGTYGTIGTPATANTPGGRISAVRWVDSNGDLWLFGGYGYDGSPSGNQIGYLNDLWKFDPIAGTWTWISGSNTVGTVGGGQSGVYGTQETPAATNTPGGREDANGWTDASGNFWLFGGFGADSNGTLGELNDLWEFNASSQQWTWISGSQTPQGVSTGTTSQKGTAGVYGTKGTASATSMPGSRGDFATWTDSDGNLWMFGGIGFDSASSFGLLNDLWKFDPSSKTWTWMGGNETQTPSTTQGAFPYTAGVYGTAGTPDPNNLPGSRWMASSWIDSDGNLWLFGGYGADSTGTEGYLNDMWEYIP